MSPVNEMTATDALLGTPTTVQVAPRYEGSNICTWIGFKHVNYLVEEAIMAHFRTSGLPARFLFEEYALGTDIVSISTKIASALHMDDVATADVKPTTKAGDNQIGFTVTLHVDRDGVATKAVVSKVKVALRFDDRSGPAKPAPTALVPFVINELGDGTEPVDAPAVAQNTSLSVNRGTSDDPVLAELTAGKNAFGWKWRMPYFYCHFTERVQMSGYLRQMEEIVDLFLADRGISIKSLLDDRNWIPVVPKSNITFLNEALMEEDLYTIYTVEDVFKDFTYTSRMDTYVIRDGKLVHTTTGKITHGYAVIENRRDWSLVNFDDRVMRALKGEQPSA